MTDAIDSTPRTERRANPRVSVALPARITGDSTTVDVETVDLSRDGVLLSGSDFPSGARVQLEIELAEAGWQRIDAEVVRREDGSGEERLAARFAEVATGGGRRAIQAFFATYMEEPSDGVATTGPAN